VDNSWILPNTFPKSNDGQLVILTSKKYLKNESYRGLKVFTDENEKIPNYIFMNFLQDSTNGFGLEPMKEFAERIILNKPFRTTVYDGLQATKIAEAVHKSAESGEVVIVE